MIINYHFDVFVGRSLNQKLFKKVIVINTGDKKPNEQFLFNAMDVVNSELFQLYPEGTPLKIINTKTEYFSQLKK